MDLSDAQDLASIIPLDFTHVFYDSEDKLSLAMALLSLVPQLLLVVYTTQIFSRREAETGLMFAGQIMSELANEYCKSVFKQERPRCKYSSCLRPGCSLTLSPLIHSC